MSSVLFVKFIAGLNSRGFRQCSYDNLVKMIVAIQEYNLLEMFSQL